MSQQRMVQIQLDKLTSHGTDAEDYGRSLAEPSADILSRIQHSGPSKVYIVGLHGVPDIADADGSANVRNHVLTLLNRIQVWGVAQNFFDVFTKLTDQN